MTAVARVMAAAVMALTAVACAAVARVVKAVALARRASTRLSVIVVWAAKASALATERWAAVAEATQSDSGVQRATVARVLSGWSAAEAMVEVR